MIGATVKQHTAELAASIQKTDWKSELTALQQGLKEDTEELGHLVKDATEELQHKAKAVAEHFPDHVRARVCTENNTSFFHCLIPVLSRTTHAPHCHACLGHHLTRHAPNPPSLPSPPCRLASRCRRAQLTRNIGWKKLVSA